MIKKEEKPAGKRELEGIVVSDKMEKTIVVEVTRVFRHPVLGKTIKSRKKYQVHDEDGKAKCGDSVLIAECRPLSKCKHMVLMDVIESATEGV